MQERDEELAARVATGDMTALEVLYRRHVDRVWRYAWFRTHSRESAAEIVQETFLRVARSVGGFEGRSEFATWLFAVTRSVAVNHFRRQRRRRETECEPGMLRLVPAGSDPADRIGRADTRAAVREALTKLPGPQRDAIVLHELSGFSVRQAAEVLGWSEPRVKTTLFRARRKLRDELGPYVSGESAKAGTKGRGKERSGAVT